MLKDVIKVSLLQKAQSDRIKNIVSVFYGIQCYLNNFELVLNPDFHFALAMDVIVCTAGVGNVLWTSVCTSPIVLKAEVLWSGLESVMMVALSSKLFK
jgi:hypothetical protein